MQRLCSSLPTAQHCYVEQRRQTALLAGDRAVLISRPSRVLAKYAWDQNSCEEQTGENIKSKCKYLETRRAVSRVYKTRENFSLANAAFRSSVAFFASFCSVTTWYQLGISRQSAGKKLLAFHTPFGSLEDCNRQQHTTAKRACLGAKPVGYVSTKFFSHQWYIFLVLSTLYIHTYISSWQTKIGRIWREMLFFKTTSSETSSKLTASDPVSAICIFESHLYHYHILPESLKV